MKIIIALMFPLSALLTVWIFVSVMASAARVSHYEVVNGRYVAYDNCDKRYPIDYILAARLFCPLKEDRK